MISAEVTGSKKILKISSEMVSWAQRFRVTVGKVVVGAFTSLPSVKSRGPRPRIPSAPLRGAARVIEPTPIDCSVMTRPLPRVRVSVYSIPNISMNVTTYDIFVCHTGEVTSTRTVGYEYTLTSADTGAGLYVLLVGANPSDRATSVDNQLVCIRQSSSISSRNF